jgi:uncharacterized protein (DUF433 family)
MSLLDRISIDPEVRFGRPGIRGTRITVGDVLGYLAGGMSEDQILSDFPQLTLERVSRTRRSASAERTQVPPPELCACSSTNSCPKN